MAPEKLQENILSTYFSLRRGIVVLSIALPLILYFGGRLAGDHSQDSMLAAHGKIANVRGRGVVRVD